MRKNSETTHGGSFTTIMLDVMFNLVMCFMLLAHVKSQKLVTVSAIASTVPDLEIEMDGLKTENGLLTDENQGHKITIGKLNTENGGLKLSIGKLGKEIGEYKSRFQSGHPVTLMILVDVTASMGVPIRELEVGMVGMCQVMANRSKEFRVGILAYRRGVVARYPITQIKPVYKDGGVSMQTVLDFIDKLEAKNGWTEHKSVFVEAVKRLQQAQPQVDSSRELIIAILGDTGPSELDGKKGYSDDERVEKQKLLDDMQKWAALGNHSVRALYAESEYTKADPSREESRKWFEALGAVSPKSAFFTDTKALLRNIHDAAGK